MSPTYFLVINGKPRGPFSLEQLKEFNIKSGDFVKTAAMDDYKEAHELVELREFLGFSKQPVIPQYFGSFDQRLLASALDWFFVSGVCILIIFIASIFVDDRELRLSLAFSLLVIIPLAKLIYHIIMECSARRATFGKQIIGIKLCDLEGNRISFARSTGRNLAKILSTIPGFTGYIFCYFNKKQQCLHDAIAGTLVMKDRLF
jgi:uncharacterized RDD family membrane protein YckC